jgi:hypothetical protein
MDHHIPDTNFEVPRRKYQSKIQKIDPSWVGYSSRSTTIYDMVVACSLITLPPYCLSPLQMQ